MSERNKITLVQKKIIKSLLYGSYDVMNIFFARIHTCGRNSEYWLYSGLEGALVYCIDIRVKACRFLMIDLKSYEIVFDCELYKKFDKAYKKGTERFYYFEVENGFIGFEIPNMEQAEILSASIISFGDDYIKKKLKEYKVMKENEIKEKSKKMIELLEKKLGQENIQPKMLRAEIVLRHGLLEKMINTVELNDETGKIIVKGNGYQGVDSDLLKLKGLNLDLKTELKLGNTEIFTNYISRNILRSYMKGLIIPKRKINRGEGVTIEKVHPYEDSNINEDEENEKEKQEPPKPKIEPPKPKIDPPKPKIDPPKPIIEPPKPIIDPPKPKDPPKPIIVPPKLKIDPPKPKIEPQKPPPAPPSPQKKEEIRESSPSKAVDVVVNTTKGVPPPPPTPPPPPPPPIVKEVKSSSSSKTSGPMDLAAELAAKKRQLTKVETKDLSIPNTQKVDSAPQSSNSMMAAIMAKRNAMKRVSDPKIQSSTLPKPDNQPKKPSFQTQKNTTNAIKKPPTSSVKPPAAKSTQFLPNKPTKPANTGGAKQPMKMSAGGGGGFAAMRNMLANRMGPQQPAKKESTGPKKPIVELGKGNVPRMNLSKLMASLENNMGKNESKPAGPVTVVCGGGAGVPPPPPPPPPPPAI